MPLNQLYQALFLACFDIYRGRGGGCCLVEDVSIYFTKANLATLFSC